jgi:ATP-binding cassette, subfamily G (WHITE), member 2, PDR
MCISFVDTADEGGNIANFFFVLIFFFCGVLASPNAMPHFWISLYRVSPLSYWISAVLTTGLANVEVTCASNEWTAISVPNGQTCGDYMADYISRVGGYLLDPKATSDCSYCKVKDTNIFLSSISSEYKDRWRNFGIMWAFIAFNIVAALALYWLVKMPKGKRKL